jgi:PilZ domain
MALSSNISVSGLYLATDLPLKVGAPVEIAMRMPEEVTGKPSSDWLCRGQVVRVEAEELPNEKHCVGVAFQYYEVIGPGAYSHN